MVEARRLRGNGVGRSFLATSGTEIPTDAQIRALHEEYAPTRDAFDLVYRHCEIVCRVAEQLLARQSIEFDVGLVRAGALLHDIGVYRLFSPSGEIDHENYVRHGVLGHDLLRELRFPDSVCRFCSCHTGMGLSKEDVLRQGLPIPVGDYIAKTDEEELVMYSDKFHSKADPPEFVATASYAAHVRRYGQDKEQRFTDMVRKWGEPDLQPLAREYGHGLR